MDKSNNIKTANIEEVYNKYLPELKLYFLKYTRDMMKAEDMCQDLFVKLFDYQTMIISETAKSFVFTIARRMIIDDARHQEFVRRSYEKYSYNKVAEKYWQEGETMEYKELKAMEQRQVDALPKQMRKIYCKTRFEEKSSMELAEELNLSKRTVEYHLFIARKRVRSGMRDAM